VHIKGNTQRDRCIGKLLHIHGYKLPFCNRTCIIALRRQSHDPRHVIVLGDNNERLHQSFDRLFGKASYLDLERSSVHNDVFVNDVVKGKETTFTL